MSRAGDINDRLRECRAEWLPQVFPHGRRRQGYFYLGNAHGEAGESLKIPLNPLKPGLRDFGNGWAGDDLGLLAEGLGVEVGEAMRHAEGLLRITPSAPAPKPKKATTTPRPERPRSRPNSPTADPGEPPTRHSQLGESSYPAWYYAPDGRMIMGHHRFDPLGGKKKEFRPVHLAAGGWKWADPPGALPLYNLGDIAAHPERPVLLVEGERTADHARDLLPDDVVTTWPHGAQAVATDLLR
jgi:putative DNA primase/helicase